MTVGPWVDRSYVGLLVDDSRLVPGMRAALDKAMGPLQAQADRAADGIARSFDRVDDRAAKVFDQVRLAGRDATDDLGVYFDVAAARIDRALDGVGDGAFTGLKAQARTAAEGVEEEFEEAGRDSDRALDRVDQPGRFRGIGAQAEREGDRVARAFRGASISAGVSLGGLRARVFGAGSVIAAALGAVGTAAVTMGLQAAASMEQAEISFSQLLGSGQRAQAFLKQLNEFGARTPFELPGLIATSRQLLGAGQAAKDIIPILTAVGNATGALGLQQEQFEGIMLAVTQAMNKGRLQGEELMQMQERGLPVTALLAKALGVTTKEVGELAQAGKLTSDEVLPKLFAQMQKDYAGSMVRQSRTLNGLWSTFMDTTRNALREGIEPLLPAIKDALPNAARILEGAIRSVVGFFRDDLGPELGRVRQAWDENGQAILRVFTTLDDGNATMSSSKSAAMSLGDGLVALTETLGNVARAAENAGNWLNQAHQTTQEWAESIRERFTGPADEAIGKTGFWAAVTREMNELLETGRLALDDIGISIGETATRTDAAATAADRHTAALHGQKEALDALSDALKDEKSADIDLRQAKLNLAVARKRVNDLAADGKTKSFEYKQAELDLERAEIRVKNATDKHRDAQNLAAAATSGAMHATQAASVAHRQFKEDADKAGRMGRLFGERVRDGILMMPKGRTLTITGRATIDWSSFNASEKKHRAQYPFQAGGVVPGTGTGDKVPIMAEPGEVVFPNREPDRVRLMRDPKVRARLGFQRGGVVPGGVRVAARGFEEMDDDLVRFAREVAPRLGVSVGGSLSGNLRRVLDAYGRRYADATLEKFQAATRLTGGSGAGFGSGSWTRAISELRREHIPYQIISTFRKGARTAASGSVSYHALNRAVDLVGPDMLAIWRALTDTNPTELIYSRAPLYKSRRGWSPISQLNPITRGDHYSHVHAAYQAGVWNLLRDQLAMVHAGEMIVPSDFAAGLRSALSGASGGATRDMVASLNDMGAVLAGELASIRGETAKVAPTVVAGFRDETRGRVVPWLRRIALGGRSNDDGGYLTPGLNLSWNGTGGRERVLDPDQTRAWEALERAGIRTAPVGGPAPTVVNVAAGAVQIDARGATPAAVPAIRAGVEDGLAEVLRQFRTGSRP